MFDKLQLVRKIVLLAYCLLISVFVCYFVYLLSFEEIEMNKIAEEHIQDQNVCEPPSSNVFGSFFFKCFLAFFAGGLVSDKIFLKAGVI